METHRMKVPRKSTVSEDGMTVTIYYRGRFTDFAFEVVQAGDPKGSIHVAWADGNRWVGILIPENLAGPHVVDHILYSWLFPLADRLSFDTDLFLNLFNRARDVYLEY